MLTPPVKAARLIFGMFVDISLSRASVDETTRRAEAGLSSAIPH